MCINETITVHLVECIYIYKLLLTNNYTVIKCKIYKQVHEVQKSVVKLETVQEIVNLSLLLVGNAMF